MNTFVVIPLFNEKKHIEAVLKGVANYGLPVIVVDDGSGDGSGIKVGSLKVKNLTVLTHKINLGKGAAMKTGAEYAFKHGADAIVFMDSDNQHDSADLAKFLAILKAEKFEVVFGSRNMNYGVPLVRYLGNKVASVVMSLLFKIYVSDPICGFRAITKKGYGKIKWESNGYGVEIEMTARVGKKSISHCEVPVQTIYNDNVKGVTILDAFGILFQVIKWKLTI